MTGRAFLYTGSCIDRVQGLLLVKTPLPAHRTGYKTVSSVSKQPLWVYGVALVALHAKLL